MTANIPALALPRPTPPTREEAAYHESGHAVAAYLTGYHYVDDDVVIDGGKTAVTPIQPDLRLLQVRVQELGWAVPDELALRRQQCFIAAAGYGAEMVLAEKRGRAFDTHSVGAGALGDRQRVGEIWGLANGAFYKFADEMAVQFRDPKVWTIVESVAQELLSRGRMYADEFIGLLEDLMAQLGVPFRLYSTVLPELQTPTLLPASN